MKKIFKLSSENKTLERHLESIKHEIRKYIKREKRKKLPQDADYWNLECKFGKNNVRPEDIRFIDIMKNIDEAASENCETFYIEIISIQGNRKPKKKTTPES